MLDHLSERQQELTFSLALLLSVGLGFAAVEQTAQMYRANLVSSDVDWDSIVDNVGYIVPGEKYPRFHPKTSFKHLNFNELGFRGPDLAKAPPANNVRIAYLGNSVLFSGELQEEDTVPALTTKLLSELVPQCHFEYVTVAGPSYTMDFLADVWTQGKSRIDADAAVVLAGTVPEVVATQEMASGKPSVENADDKPKKKSLFEKSAFVALLKRQLVLTSPVAAEVDNQKFDVKVLAKSYATMSQKLVTSLDGTPVIALGYREALRAGQPAGHQLWISRGLRATVPGLSVDQAVELSEMVVSELEFVSANANWQFLDLLGKLPGEKEYFRDFEHLSKKGAVEFSKLLAQSIKQRVAADCSVAESKTAVN
jgi:hypothetical protein